MMNNKVTALPAANEPQELPAAQPTLELIEGGLKENVAGIRSKAAETVAPKTKETKSAAPKKQDLIKIPVAALQPFGLFEGKTDKVTEAEAIQAAKTLDSQHKIDALSTIPDLVRAEKDRLQAERKETLVRRIKQLISKTNNFNDLRDLRRFKEQIVKNEDLAVARDAALIQTLEARIRLLGDKIKAFDAVAKGPNGATFHIKTPKGFYNYAIQYVLTKDQKMVIIPTVVAERPDAPSLGISTVKSFSFRELPHELKLYVFGLDGNGKIFLRNESKQAKGDTSASNVVSLDSAKEALNEAEPKGDQLAKTGTEGR